MDIESKAPMRQDATDRMALSIKPMTHVAIMVLIENSQDAPADPARS